MTKHIKKRTVFAILTSVLMVGLVAFEWSLLESLTFLLYLPLMAFCAALFGCAALFSLSCLQKYNEIGLRVLAPLLIQAAAVAIIMFVPFTSISLDFNFITKKQARMKIVQRVSDNTLVYNVEHNSRLISLGKEYGKVSAGGNDIVVLEGEAVEYVFFYTFRGIGNYSGYLYIPENGNIDEYKDLVEERRVNAHVHEGRWYFVSHS